MLTDGEHIETHLLGHHGQLDHSIDPLRLAGRVARNRIAGYVTDREHTELHDDLSGTKLIYASAYIVTVRVVLVFPRLARCRSLAGGRRQTADNH